MENIIFAVLVLGAIAIVFGLILSVAAKVFEVKVDERLPKIQECLAGANCGGCGYPGCAGCAEAILAGKAPVTACAPAGAEGAAKIAAIMGMEAPSGEKMVAHVICNGGDAAVKNFEYVGIADCVGALKVAGGPTACSFGCLGFGSCVAACQFDALHINDKGVAEVEYIVGLTWEDPAAAYVRDGVAVKVVFPEEGALMSGQCVSIIKGAPHMENAKKFVDYMLSETCQNYVGQNLTVRPLRQNVQLNDSLTPWSEITRLESYDGVWVAANKSAITEKYSECLENVA